MSPSDGFVTIRHCRPTAPTGRPADTNHPGGQVPRIPLETHQLALRHGITLHDHTVRPCMGYANGCGCPTCANLSNTVSAHRAAGRHPFTPDGKLRALPRKAQPWDGKQAA